MPRFDIIKEVEVAQTYRNSSVVGAFDIDEGKISEHFSGNIAIEGEDWNVGLIVGGSGTGKTTIAKDAFGDGYFNGYEYDDGTVIDNMPKNKSVKDIMYTFTSVGFASPPSWLKPYNVLSNGEKMRVDLARSILEEADVITFDEFTSVVDRQVAKTSSYAISKAVRKLDAKFIAVACHKDIIDWLEPDWIYDTDEKTFHYFTKGDQGAQKLTLRSDELKIKTKVAFGESLENITI